MLMGTIRTFIAVEAPEAVIARLEALQEALREAGAEVSWVRPAGLHVTLKFLGDVEEECLPAISDALAALATRHAPFTQAVAGTGVFPDARHPRIVWVGLGEGAPALAALARDTEAAMAALGFPREERPFRPHLTLGRVKGPHGLAALLARLQAHAGDDFGAMPVAEVTLMRSDLSPQGACYTPLTRVTLTGSG